MYYYDKKGFDSELRGYLLDYLCLKILYVSAVDLNGTMFMIHIEIAALLFGFWLWLSQQYKRKWEIMNHVNGLLAIEKEAVEILLYCTWSTQEINL
jgi:hypothetical protein